MSYIEQIYHQVQGRIRIYLDSILSKIQSSTSTEFIKLSLTQHLVRVFTALLSFIATCYELMNYASRVKLSDLITL